MLAASTQRPHHPHHHQQMPKANATISHPSTTIHHQPPRGFSQDLTMRNLSQLNTLFNMVDKRANITS
jgi:hypothetical protein